MPSKKKISPYVYVTNIKVFFLNQKFFFKFIIIYLNSGMPLTNAIVISRPDSYNYFTLINQTRILF